MRIRIFSDLHLEFRSFDPPEHRAGSSVVGRAHQDLVVLAGDVDSGAGGIRWARKYFPDVPVVAVAGNHEHYGREITQSLEDMKDAAYGSLVTVLEREEIHVGGIRFLGCTLWTDFEVFGAENRQYAMTAAARGISDFVAIKLGRAHFTPADAAKIFKDSAAWLQSRLESPFPGPTVVITHHAPHRMSIHPQFATDILTAAFVSDLERLLGKCALWIHGHTHSYFDYVVRGTRVVCNPRGYYSFERTGFNPRLVISVDPHTGAVS